MAAEIVHDDDIAGSKRGDQDLFDIGSEGLAIDWGVEKPRRLDPVVAQCRQERSSLPVTMRDLADQTLAARRPARNGAMLVLVQGSSMKTRRSGSMRS